MAKNIIKIFGLDPLMPLLGVAALTYKFPQLSAIWVLAFFIVLFRKNN